MNDAEHTEANMGERAKALADFARYTDHGTLYMMRNAPRDIECAIERVSASGIQQCEEYLRGMPAP